MAKFEVRITQRAFPKGTEEQVRKEWYEDWSTADTAFELYNKLAAINESGITHAELIEHKQEVVHKTSEVKGCVLGFDRPGLCPPASCKCGLRVRAAS